MYHTYTFRDVLSKQGVFQSDPLHISDYILWIFIVVLFRGLFYSIDVMLTINTFRVYIVCKGGMQVLPPERSPLPYTRHGQGGLGQLALLSKILGLTPPLGSGTGTPSIGPMPVITRMHA